MGRDRDRSGNVLEGAGRLLLAAIFVHGGWHAFKDPAKRPDQAARLGLPQPELMVRANGAAMAAGGVALALGIFPVATAAGLIASLIPTTLAGHRFWEEDDQQARRMQLTQFLKNAGLIGGLVLLISRRR
jgi:putative oxidoreductase